MPEDNSNKNTTNNGFVHLHLHTQYSLLDGANKVKDVVKRAKAHGQEAIAITDHGTMHGAIEFYDAAKKNEIKPIIGCELYVSNQDRRKKVPVSKGGSPQFHLTVLASNLEGYRNLCRLVSLGFKEGFYHKPRVDHEVLERYNEGLIVLSGCLGSELGRAAMADNEDEVKKTVEFYSRTFKDRYYLEVQPHKINEQRKLNDVCQSISKSHGIQLVASTDCHYGGKDDHFAQEVLMCISTGKKIDDPDRMQHVGVNLHLKTDAEMREEFRQIGLKDEAINASLEIANRCNLEFDFNTYYMPKYSASSEDEHCESMKEISRNGLKERLGSSPEGQVELDDEQLKKYDERLEFELNLIEKMGFASYFLVVSDFIIWAKEHGIPVGPGRGSVAGSLVAWAMRITEVDPIRHQLLFERFLNPDRISLPDIDVDFCINGRAEVIQYVSEKYGKENVSQIATFGTLKAKAAIKDVGRALGVPYSETDKIAQLIPAPRQGFDYSLTDSIEMEPRLKQLYEGEYEELITLALKLEGLTRHTSTHAAGVVIGDRPLMDLLPMMVDKDGLDVTQYSMNHVEKVGLVKFDFLGLKTLTVIDTACKIIEKSRDVKVDVNALALDDTKTFKMLCSGNTVGVFQLESGGITEMTMRLKPSCFDDLVAILALYRPGPLDAGMVDRYIERKHKREPVTYLHPLMESVLNATYGIMLYQEQIMKLAQILAGYSLAEADFLRKAMGKKNPVEMQKQKKRFLEGADKNKLPRKISEDIFSQMETFARYGFNKSHSVAYAMVSYHTAYLKAHYPVEFMAALMSHDGGDTDKILKNLIECKKQKIKVLPPDLNESYSGFSVDNNCIRYGLEAVKGIGSKVVTEITNTRGDKPFKDVVDFLCRQNPGVVKRKTLESLIKCGACDCFGVSRRELFERVEELVLNATHFHKEKNSRQLSIFKKTAEEANRFEWRVRGDSCWTKMERLRFERQSLGFYLSGHPIEKYRRELSRFGVRRTIDLKSGKSGTRYTVAGVVTALKLKNTKKGDRYASFILEDEFGTVECLMWPRSYVKEGFYLEREEPLLMTGKADISDERCSFIVDTIKSASQERKKKISTVRLVVNGVDTSESKFSEIKNVLEKFPGDCNVLINYSFEGVKLELPLPLRVNPSDKLSEEIERIYGKEILVFS